MQKRRRLFHATDLRSLMCPCFTICHLLGIFPYKISASTFAVSKPRLILSTVIICVYCVFYFLLMHDTIIYKNITFRDVTGNLEAACYFTLSGIVAIVTYILSVPRMRLLQTILEISSKLPSESYQELSRFIHVKDIFGTILLIVQAYVYYFKVEMFELNYMNAITMVLGLYVALVALQMNMLYTNCVCILKECFKEINDDLTHLQILINDMKSFIPSFICHMQRNQFFPIKLRTLMKRHLMISRAVQMLNIIFSLQLLTTIVMFFSEITFGLYFYAVRWQEGLLIHFGWRFLFSFLANFMHLIVQVTALVWACEAAKNQAQEIGTTIHDVVNSTSDEQIKDELQLFSLQILHCKNTFLAKGLTVDATLVTAMVGSITTYMLILIQFLITTHSCDGNV